MAAILALKVDRTRPVRRGSSYMWSVVRDLTAADRSRPFTVADVLGQTNGTELSTVRRWMGTLVRAGLAEQVDGGYRLLRRPVLLPHITNDGRIVSLGQDALWTAMRALKEFTPRELAIAAATEERPVTEWTAKSYVKMLSAAGYLAMVATATSRRQARYRLRPSMNSGSLAPQILRAKLVWDPNRNEVVGETEAEEVTQ